MKAIKYDAKNLRYCDKLRERAPPLVVAVGPAGCGKTMFACKLASEALHDRVYNKIVVTRPVVHAEENHGYLPGTLDEKMHPWMLPVFDHIQPMSVEMCPLSFMRGRTFDNTFIIADEMQNSTVSQMKTLLTRVGRDSKIVITGDLEQCDLDGDENGLQHLMSLAGVLEDETWVSIIAFDENDIRRSDFVKFINHWYI